MVFIGFFPEIFLQNYLYFGFTESNLKVYLIIMLLGLT